LATRFQHRYLAVRQLHSFPWQELEENLQISPDSSLLLDILHKTVLHPLGAQYPPPTKYRRSFLTQLIKKHEPLGAEPLDELYDALAEALNAEESTRCYKSYFLPSGEPVTLCESLAIVSGGTTGLVTWEAGLQLAQWAIENGPLFQGRTVLELGSGIGFTGIAVCKCCHPRAYVFSDGHPGVLRALADNIRLNGFFLEPWTRPGTPREPRGRGAEARHGQKPTVAVAELDWGSVTEKQLWELQPDILMAADVVYDPETISALIGVLQKLSACRAEGKPPEVYVASTIRNPETHRLFQAELERAGIGWQVIPAPSNTAFLYDVQPNVNILQLFL
ncbi:EF2KT methyltransferase, partial [Jacana jacana]|nr:EF2KT methyltransferase [Jacana jacana]